jgi:SAM-dependent methyltransferase
MNWKLRCAINTCKALVPFHERLRQWKRMRAYAGDAHNEQQTIDQGLLQIEWISGEIQLAAANVLEVGTGWEPLIPILFSLAGARRIYTCDLNRLCAISTFEAALASIRRHREQIQQRLHLTSMEFDAALDLDHSTGLEAALEKLRITYLAPCDCRNVPLDSESLDVVTSRAVLEHIPPGIIAGIYTDSFRLLRRGGVMCHIVDNSDHWQHVDRSISRVNFLKFPDWKFRWTCVNGLDYQNRLRHSEHVGLMTGAGFEVLREERDVDAGSIEALRTLQVAPRFKRFSAEDLAVLTSTLLVRKPLPA